MGSNKAPAVPSKKKARAAARPKLARQIGIVLSSGTLLAAAVGTYLVYTFAGDGPSPVTAATQAAAPPSAAAPVDQSGSIVIKSASGCRRMKFDNATGAITDDGATACPEGGLSTSGGLSARSEAQVARFGQIANGFKH